MAREDMFELPVPMGNKAEEQHQDPVTSFSLNTKLAVASIGFFTDAYDLFVINLVMVILTSLYSITDFQGANIATFALVGAIAGQLFFGFAGDSIGRFTSWIVTMSLIIVGALATAFAPTSSTATVAMWIAIWRLLLGVGIGGEYPLSSVVPSEASASSHSRGRNIALVFAMQGWGNLFAPVFIYVLLQILGSSDRSLEIIWRVALGFGAVPCMVTFYFRYMMFKEAQNHEKQNRKVRLNLQKVKENAKYLVGTAGSWFIFDIVFYANGLFNGLVLAQLFGTSSKEMKHNLSKTALSGIVIALIALPGYYAAVLLIDRIGRKPLQIIGFFMMAVLYFILGFFYQTLHQKVVWFVIIYGLTFFFSNFGPNTTTFVLPGEIYRKDVRSTFHGVSAACGKMGAVLGGLFMKRLFDNESTPFGPGLVFIVAGVISIIGLGLSMTSCVPETKGMQLDNRLSISEELDEEKPLMAEKQTYYQTEG